jgi:hypothetical protein
MSAKSAIEKLHRVTKERETQRSEHKQKQDKKAEMLKKKAEEELRRRDTTPKLDIYDCDKYD